MKKALHVLAIIAAGAMVMAAMGCATLKTVEVTPADLVGTVWVEQNKLGPVWVNKVGGKTITFIDENNAQVKEGLNPGGAAPYKIDNEDLKKGRQTTLRIKQVDALDALITGAVSNATNIDFDTRGDVDFYAVIDANTMIRVSTGQFGAPATPHDKSQRFVKQKAK